MLKEVVNQRFFELSNPWSLFNSSTERLYPGPASIYQACYPVGFSGFIAGKYEFHDIENKNSADVYSSDEFRMFKFKVKRCVRSRSHDWTECPYAHFGEKARRRDPRKFNYSGNACPEFRKGNCERGETCEFAHGVFEFWLHPARYRTQLCKSGKNCSRKVCFFAHSLEQLRFSPEELLLNRNPSSPVDGLAARRIPVASRDFSATLTEDFISSSGEFPIYNEEKDEEIRRGFRAEKFTKLSKKSYDDSFDFPDFDWVSELVK